MSQLGPIQLSPTPKAARNVDEFQRNVSVWTRQVEQTVRQIENFLNSSSSGSAKIVASSPLSYDSTSGSLTILQAGTSQNGYLSSVDWNTFNSKLSSTRLINTSAPLSGGGDLSADRTISISKADATHNGYLSDTDWNTFNGKQSALIFGNFSETTSSILTITGGTGAVIGSGVTVAVTKSDSTHNGYLSDTDWNTFNGKQAALTFGNLTETTSSILTITGGTGAVVGSGATIAVTKADATHNGYLSDTDWNTFHNFSNRGRIIILCAGFTPQLTGPDVIEIPIPYSPVDGTTSLTWAVRRIFVRVQTAGGAPSVRFELSTGTGGFSASTIGTVTLGSGAYEAAVTSALGTVASGNKVRFNVITLATAQNWTIGLEITNP